MEEDHRNSRVPNKGHTGWNRACIRWAVQTALSQVRATPPTEETGPWSKDKSQRTTQLPPLSEALTTQGVDKCQGNHGHYLSANNRQVIRFISLKWNWSEADPVLRHTHRTSFSGKPWPLSGISFPLGTTGTKWCFRAVLTDQEETAGIANHRLMVVCSPRQVGGRLPPGGRCWQCHRASGETPV